LAAQIQDVLVINTSSNPVPVAGTVNVGNLPASQQVSGTVSVGNFPATQTVNVSGGTISAAPQVSTVIKGTGFHAVDFAEGDTFNLGAPGFNVTGIAINDGLGEQDSWRLNIFGVPSRLSRSPVAAATTSLPCRSRSSPRPSTRNA
jgi:hypothetical protein